MNIDELKQIVKNEEGKIIIVENGKPSLVVMSFEEYKKNLKKNNFAPPVGKLASFSNLSPKRKLPKELQEEELKIEDLPF